MFIKETIIWFLKFGVSTILSFIFFMLTFEIGKNNTLVCIGLILIILGIIMIFRALIKGEDIRKILKKLLLSLLLYIYSQV